MIARQIVGRRQPMHAAADDHDIVAVLEVVGAPHGRKPVFPVQSTADKLQESFPLLPAVPYLLVLYLTLSRSARLPLSRTAVSTRGAWRGG